MNTPIGTPSIAPGPSSSYPSRSLPIPLSSIGYHLSRYPAIPLIAALAFVLPARAERVTVVYEAEASTVSNTPFGLTVPRLTIVRGYFTYETNTPDTLPNDPKRGDFLMQGTWDFRAEFLDQVLRGSGTAPATTNLFGSPTLRFWDGAADAAAGDMSLNGITAAGLRMSFSISGQSKDLPTDQLPRNFTFNPPPGGASHTFSIGDGSGTMLLQFRSFRQFRPEIRSVRRTGNDVEILWSSVKGKPYALEFSTDLRQWDIIRNDLVGQWETTTVVDPVAVRFAGNPPPAGFYRILDRPPF